MTNHAAPKTPSSLKVTAFLSFKISGLSPLVRKTPKEKRKPRAGAWADFSF
jgi:hypothetical protein